MKIFEQSDKINFVDINNVFVGYDSFQDCCEDHGFLFAKTYPTPETLGEASTPQDKISGIDLGKYNFDTDFFAEMHPESESPYAIFKLVGGDEKEVLFLVLYNHHNGYYAHGFEFGLGYGKDGNGIYNFQSGSL